MGLAVATFLILFLIVGTVAFLVGVPVAFGLMAYDVIQSRKSEQLVSAVHSSAKDLSTHIAVKRGVARGFVLVGGAFWSLAAFAALYSYGQTGAGQAFLAALIPLGACLATLVLGWYYERVTAALLLLASVAVVAAGVIYQFQAGTWAIMVFALIGPMMTASVLFRQARGEQEAFELATSLRPDVSMLFSARSSLAQ